LAPGPRTRRDRRAHPPGGWTEQTRPRGLAPPGLPLPPPCPPGFTCTQAPSWRQAAAPVLHPTCRPWPHAHVVAASVRAGFLVVRQGPASGPARTPRPWVRADGGALVARAPESLRCAEGPIGTPAHRPKPCAHARCAGC